MALTRGRWEELPPSEQANVRGIVRDEVLATTLESECLGSVRRPLVQKKTGKVRPWVETLVKLEESLSRRRRDLEKLLGAMEPKRAVSLAEYIESRGSGASASAGETEIIPSRAKSPGGDPRVEREADSPSGASGGSESAFLDAGKGQVARKAENGFRTESKTFSGDSRNCEGCGVDLPARARRGKARRFCSARCRKLGWLAANRAGSAEPSVEAGGAQAAAVSVEAPVPEREDLFADSGGGGA
jgi:endogenous inhibitor of DNA gyrase (YacG/DUF329 family)